MIYITILMSTIKLTKVVYKSFIIKTIIFMIITISCIINDFFSSLPFNFSNITSFNRKPHIIIIMNLYPIIPNIKCLIPIIVLLGNIFTTTTTFTMFNANLAVFFLSHFKFRDPYLFRY